MPNRYASERIWLMPERPRDDAADVLRGGGAEVTVVHANGGSSDAGAHDARPSIVVITSSKTGRALVRTVGRLSGDEFAGMTILVCEEAGPLDVRALLRVGVRGIVLREQMQETLLPAVAAVASGQVCVPPQDVIGAARPVLSIREKQVIGLVAMGLMNIEIAERLYLAESTVKSHLSSAFAKLGVRSRHEAVELLLNPASGLGLGILSLDTEAIPAGSGVADLQ
ncbi:MAG TPA: response regulator transcription factor [Solirubrobacteraceae bacterium]|nr:response regulator transcription factor [Solirubrobacteraceae bacterium]